MFADLSPVQPGYYLAKAAATGTLSTGQSVTSGHYYMIDATTYGTFSAGDLSTYLPGAQAVTWGQVNPAGVRAVNGRVGPWVDLTPADVGALPIASLGVANGVASLDSGGHLPVAQLPSAAVLSVNGHGGPTVTLATSDVLPTWHNVKDPVYGATGNGSIDDTSAIQAALTAAASSGGRVFIPQGTYVLSSALNVSANTIVQGDGAQTTILKQTSTTANGLTCLDSVAVTIRDLEVQGPGSGSGVGIAFTLSARTTCYQVTLADLLVRSFGGDGVNMATPIVSRLTRVVSQTNGGDGFHLTGGGTSVVFDGTYGNGNTGNNYHLDSLNYCSLSGCASDSAGAIGYLLNNCDQVGLVGCGAEVPTGNPFKVSGGRGVSLVSCYSRGNPSIGLWFTGSHFGGFVQGFYENGPTGTATASIQVDLGCVVTSGINATTTNTSFATGTTSQLTNNTLAVSGSTGTSSAILNRAATSNLASLALQTAGATQWNIQTRNDSTNDLHVRDGANGVDSMIFEQHAGGANIQIGSAKSFGSGSIGVVGIANANTAPTGNPTGGGVLYASGGALVWRGSSGTVTTIAPA